MFDVGFSELVLLFVIGLLILGPERLPKVASQIGRWVGRARRTANQLRHQLEREMALNEISKSTQWKPPKQQEDKSTDQTAAQPESSSESDSAAASSAADSAPDQPGTGTEEPPSDSKSA